MTYYKDMKKQDLESTLSALQQEYQAFKAQNLNLDMTRGKPCSEQLDITDPMLTILQLEDVLSQNGFDCRNYGILDGLPEAKAWFANILHVKADQVIIGNNSSLNVMHDTLMRAMVFGEIESTKPWAQESKKKWLCPVPGYDRHFALTEAFGFELVNIPLTPEGPDMDRIEKLVAEDEDIKGIWCVPLYSNPDGYVYSEEVCERLAKMKTKALDFRIYWDNAYAVHHLYGQEAMIKSIPNILEVCEQAGNPNRVYEFASTSKITYAGGGISCVACNKDNRAHQLKNLGIQTIGSDKLNQLRHIKYMPNSEDLTEVMKKQASVIRPKFEKTLEILQSDLEAAGIACWNRPTGGYFISLYVFPQTAKTVVSMAKSIGVAFTPAGATFPYGLDPQDSNIRIAPTFPDLISVEKAVKVLAVCAKIAAIEKILQEA